MAPDPEFYRRADFVREGVHQRSYLARILRRQPLQKEPPITTSPMSMGSPHPGVLHFWTNAIAAQTACAR